MTWLPYVDLAVDWAAPDGPPFDLPRQLEAGEPPEARGLARDEVRLLVSRGEGRSEHLRFRDLDTVLDAGDVLAINTSGTLNASLDVLREDGSPLELHLSTRLPAGLWLVEARTPGEPGSTPFRGVRAGERLALPGGAEATLLAPYAGRALSALRGEQPGARLWVATLDLPDALAPYLECYGSPIRYGYVKHKWPSRFYQTVYANEMGSAEMPSAGRAFTAELITRLVARGVRVAPLVLHTGVASLEDHEPPYEEFYRVPIETARAANDARARGRRVVAVGTTVVRALETVTDEEGETHPGEGWTRLVIEPRRRVRSVTALLTGLHEPRSTHLAMLEAIAGREHLRSAYAEALREGYLWHEFGDAHLLLPTPPLAVTPAP